MFLVVLSKAFGKILTRRMATVSKLKLEAKGDYDRKAMGNKLEKLKGSLYQPVSKTYGFDAFNKRAYKEFAKAPSYSSKASQRKQINQAGKIVKELKRLRKCGLEGAREVEE